jgi:hypothetical protein
VVDAVFSVDTCAAGVTEEGCFRKDTDEALKAADTSLKALREETGCRTANCLLATTTGVEHDILAQQADRLVPVGPIHKELLTNEDLDVVLNRWMAEAGSTYVNLGFTMIDFEEDVDTYDSLCRISNLVRVILATYGEHNPDALVGLPDSPQAELLRGLSGRRLFGTVFNTDVTRGPGQHWFSVVLDLRPAGSVRDPFVIQYYNSSGRAPQAQVGRWMDRLWFEFRQNKHLQALFGHGKSATPREIKKLTVCRIMTQPASDNHSCGVRSLMHQWYVYREKSIAPLFNLVMPEKLFLKYRRFFFRSEKPRDYECERSGDC